jgi:predicted phosphodiesterase
MRVNHFLLFFFIASALLVVSPNLIIQGIQAKSHKADDPFSGESILDVNPSIGKSDSKGIEPKSTSGTTRIDAVGDLDCSNGLHDQIKKDKPDYFIALGDLCYNPDLSEFHSTWNDINNGKEFACVIGNHDAEEDGNPTIFKQVQQYCKDHWYRKVAGGTTLLLGLDTNGDIQSQILWGQNLVTDQSIMKGVKTVIFFSHKMAHSPPSHHHVESSTIELYEKIQSSIPKGIGIYEVAGHNHIMAESKNGHWFVSGAGGESHYQGFTTVSDWPFVNDKDYGYLQLQIDNNDGNVISTHFYGLDGGLIH